jgi:hypothetical protein
VKGTRLWQDAGSPLIRGRSRYERPFWHGWIGGALVAWIAFAAVEAVLFGLGKDGGVSYVTALVVPVLGVVPGVLIGAGLGAWFAALSGLRSRWMGGALFGFLGAWLWLLILPGIVGLFGGTL